VRQSKHKILVVDDEPQIARVLRRGLETHEFEVRLATDGQAGYRTFQTWPPDLIITDLAMPNITGLEFCTRVRQTSTVPILVLSVKGEESVKVQALDAGADDYVTKPFGMDELLARVRALLRRSKPIPESSEAAFQSGDFMIEPQQRRITVRGREIHLTPKEYDLLIFFLSHPARVLTHRFILTAVWGSSSSEQPQYLRVFIGQLRKKIEADPGSPRYIVTEPWIGYRFNPGT
jgi:two-component system KDP operon response regulator KdpE